MTEPVSVPLEGNPPGRPRKNYVPRHLDVVALVDAVDAERVLAQRWTLHKARSGIYVKEVGKGGEFLHRFVLELPSQRENGLVVDHKNHDRLDNRRENLRAVANVLNLANSGSRPGSSRFKGVTFDRSRNKWIAQIVVGEKHQHLGRFASQDEAALAYNLAAVQAWGEHAQLNVIDDTVTLPARREPSSQYRGVSWIARDRRWRVSVRVSGKLRYFGHFTDEKAAARAYNAAAREVFGDRAKLNEVD